MGFMRKSAVIVTPLLSVFFSSCAVKEDAYTASMFVMNVPAQVKVYGADPAEGARIADAVFAEWKRIASEYSFNEPYSYTSYVNKKAYGEWVKVDDEFLRLLVMSMEYYRLSNGAFDVTFAPLWPIWKEAASSHKLPAKEDISKALASIGFKAVQIDYARKMVRFARPIQINMGGVLRVYGFVKGYRVLREVAGDKYPVELRLGGNMMAYGTRKWVYDIPAPFHDKKVFGRLLFDNGVVISASGRDSFVQIEGKLYSHILDLKTGYPVENFSNLVVYYPKIDDDDFIPSVVLAVMGRDKAFEVLSKMKGTAAVWIDGTGKADIFMNKESRCSWEKVSSFF